MNPDKKYMDNTDNKTSGDLNLVPFKTPMSSNMPIGWIPVFYFNKLNTAGSPFMMPNLTNINNIPSMTGSLPANKSNVETFPSTENVEILHSYNKTNTNAGTNTSSSGNMSSMNNMGNEQVSNVLRNYFSDLDENTDLLRKCSDKRINKIYAKIEEKYPEIISMFVDNYKIPCPIVKAAIRKIIKLSLYYCKKAGD